MQFQKNIKQITPNKLDIKNNTPVLIIGDKVFVNGIGGNFIPLTVNLPSITVTAEDVLNTKVFCNSNGILLTGNISSQISQEFMPTTVDQIIVSGQYLAGNQIIKGDENLLAQNIKKDISIFGITGTFFGGTDNILGVIDENGKFQELYFDGLSAFTSGQPQDVQYYQSWNSPIESDPPSTIVIAENYYQCASTDSVNKKWNGYKATYNSIDGTYSFASSVTSGLDYLYIVPQPGYIYNSNASVFVKSIYKGITYPDLWFTLTNKMQKINNQVGIKLYGDAKVTLNNGLQCGTSTNNYAEMLQASRERFANCMHTEQVDSTYINDFIVQIKFKLLENSILSDHYLFGFGTGSGYHNSNMFRIKISNGIIYVALAADTYAVQRTNKICIGKYWIYYFRQSVAHIYIR